MLEFFVVDSQECLDRAEQLSRLNERYSDLGLCVVAHLFIRARLPDADPYMFPLTAVLAGIGLVLIYRIDAELAREQAQWFVVGLAFFCMTIVLIDDHHVLERYRYTIAAASIALLMMPRLPGIGAQVNGAFLAIKVGPIQFQPAEFAKLGIIVFLASYLRETGDILVRPRLRPLPGVEPPLRCREAASLLADLLGFAITDTQLRGLARQRSLPSVRLGGCWLLCRADLEHFVRIGGTAAWRRASHQAQP